jgi:hypothetical protein
MKLQKNTSDYLRVLEGSPGEVYPKLLEKLVGNGNWEENSTTEEEVVFFDRKGKEVLGVCLEDVKIDLPMMASKPGGDDDLTEVVIMTEESQP